MESNNLYPGGADRTQRSKDDVHLAHARELQHGEAASAYVYQYHEVVLQGSGIGQQYNRYQMLAHREQGEVLPCRGRLFDECWHCVSREY